MVPNDAHFCTLRLYAVASLRYDIDSTCIATFPMMSDDLSQSTHPQFASSERMAYDTAGMKLKIAQSLILALAWVLAGVLGGTGFLIPLRAADESARQSHEKVAPPGSRGNAQIGEAEQLFRQAADLIDKDRPGAAIPLLRRALELAPNEGRIHHYLGYALMKSSQLPAAQKEFEIALKLEPGDVYSEYFLAQTLDMQGFREQALALYERILSSGNVIYDTYQRLGQAYARKKEYDKAVAMLQQALQQTPWDGSLHTQLGAIYRKMGREEEAKQEFAEGERIKNVDEASIQKMLQLTEALRLKDSDRVKALRADLMNQSGKDPDLMTWLGVLLGRGGLYPEALEPLEKAMDAGPCTYETCYNLGLTLARLGRDQDAEAPLRKAVELHPHSYEANLVLSIAYVNAGRNQEAIERLQVAHRAHPDNLRVALLLGQQYLQGWYLQQAIETFREALKLQPDNVDTRYLLLEAYQNDKAYEKALQVAQETVKLHPEEARAHFEVGHQLANLGHYQEARPYFEEAIHLDASMAPARIWLADAQLRNGENEAALENYEKVRNEDPGSLDAARGMARTLFRMRRYPEALADVQNSIAAHPEDAELHLILAQIQTRLGNSLEAAQANAAFEKLHAAELAKQNDQRPRTYVAGSHTPTS